MKVVNRQIIQGKKVLVRLDLDMPLDGTTITDLTRLRCVQETLELLKSAEQITIIGHLGRPGGAIVDTLRLGPVAQALSQILGAEIVYTPSLHDADIRKSLGKKKKWHLLENLRFHPGEEQNDPTFSRQLAAYGDIFVFDAFAVAHREAASTVGIPHHLPSYAGLRVAHEVDVLSSVLDHPEHPFLAIIGGAKIETKLPVITRLIPLVDRLFIGGKLIKEIKKHHPLFDPKVIVGQETDSGLDITEESQKQVATLIHQANLIVWNGPPGKFEDPQAEAGTRAITNALATATAKTIIGGGETIEAVQKYGIADKIDFISVGGGAMLDFLSGKQLPALHALEREEKSL